MLENMIRKTRVDGNIDSAVRYLTKEDGGKDFSSVEEFEKYYSRSEKEFNWIPGLDKRLGKNDVGIPGEYIAKISSDIQKRLGKSIEHWGEYRAVKLYRGFEHNIKFYPVGRHNDNSFPDSVKHALGQMEKHEYEAYIRDYKSEKFQHLFSEHPARLNIVLAAEAEWAEVFRRIHGEIVIEDIGDYIHVARDRSGKFVYTYFPVFGRFHGSKNARAEKVAEIAAEQLLAQSRNE